MIMSFRKFLVLTAVLVVVTCQDFGSGGGDGGDYPDYQDYADPDYGGQDNLYSDYANRQHNKEVGGGIGVGKLLLGGAFTWMLGGKFHSGRTAKKLKAKFQKEQKQLYTQYYNDVYKLTEQNQELQQTVEKYQAALQQTESKHELEALQRDYDEFKQPDVDGDDRISRAEFNMYVKNYLANYPGLKEKDYPKFEDFDHDGDGFVSFQEYAQQMALQAKQAEIEALYGEEKSSTKAQGLQDLYAETQYAGSFDQL